MGKSKTDISGVFNATDRYVTARDDKFALSEELQFISEKDLMKFRALSIDFIERIRLNRNDLNRRDETIQLECFSNLFIYMTEMMLSAGIDADTFVAGVQKTANCRLLRFPSGEKSARKATDLLRKHTGMEHFYRKCKLIDMYTIRRISDKKVATPIDVATKPSYSTILKNQIFDREREKKASGLVGV